MRVTASTLLSASCLVASTCAAPATPAVNASAQCTVTQGYSVKNVVTKGAAVAKYAYEFGDHANALIEYYNPKLSVFYAYSFPEDNIPTVNGSEQGLVYAAQHIQTGQTTLANGLNDSGAPATLGVPAILLGTIRKSYAAAAANQANYLLNTVQKLYNGAISSRINDAEAWDEWILNATPFLAYYAASTKNPTLLNYTVSQIGLYRSLLQTGGSGNAFPGAWQHLDSLATDDDMGVWSTGQGVATYGIARVLATVQHWGTSAGYTSTKASLVQWAKELVDAQINGNQRIGGISEAAARVNQDDQGLIQNYYVSGYNPWFGETTGTAWMAAAIYRLAVLAPDTFGASYINWAEISRGAINGHVYSDGTLSPAIDPYNSTDNIPYSQGSPVGQSGGIVLAAAWRDCVCAGICSS